MLPLGEYFKQFKIFLTAMVMVFIIVSLQYLGIHAPNIVHPVSEKMNQLIHTIQGGATYD